MLEFKRDLLQCKTVDPFSQRLLPVTSQDLTLDRLKTRATALSVLRIQEHEEINLRSCAH